MTLRSLFRRVTIPILAVTATAALYAPARAATASYDVIQADPDTSTGIRSRVHVNITDSSQWNGAIFHTQLLGGTESYASMRYTNLSNVGGACYGNGDYYFPSKTTNYYFYIYVNGGGTYNNWCICDGGSSGGAWYASTGGTDWVYR